MTKIYDRFKAQEDCTEKRVEAEQQLEMETDARCAQEKEMKRVHVSNTIIPRTQRLHKQLNDPSLTCTAINRVPSKTDDVLQL